MSGGGGVFLSIATIVVGVVSLPNASSNILLTCLSALCAVAGALILITTLVRFVAKKFYRM